jgi:hypothetical protein
MKRSHIFSLCVSLPLVISACGQSSGSGGGSSGGGGSKTPENTPENPAPGTVSETAGFFVKLSGEYADLFSIHKGESTFSEKCEAKIGERNFCIVEAEEMRFAAHDVSLHYHIPKTMCEYIRVMPYYFVNHQIKKQTTDLHTYFDKNGEFGTGVDANDLVNAYDFGCHVSEKLEPICCVGKYNWVKHVWDETSGKYSVAPQGVNYTAESCLGGPALASQGKNELGFPVGTYYYVPGEGKSATYDLKGTDSSSSARHGIVWNVNYFNPSDHPAPAVDGIPVAMNYDFDPTAATDYVGNPYYTFTCLDSAWEIKSQINVQLRDWDTKAGYDARATAPTGYRDEGVEETPFGNTPKNDKWNWKDIEVRSSNFPGKLPAFDSK